MLLGQQNQPKQYITWTLLQLITGLMECVAGILIRSTPVIHKHFLNDPL